MTAELRAKRVIEDLRVALFRKRISATQLSKRLGRSYSQVSRRLNDEVTIDLAELFTYADAAGLNVSIRISDPTSFPSDVDAAAAVPSAAAAHSGAPEASPSADTPKAGAPGHHIGAGA